MATTGTTQLTNEVKPIYDGFYYLAGQSNVFFDQFADLRVVTEGQKGSSYNFPIVESLQPNASVLDEYTDVSSQQMRVNEIVVSLSEYGGAIDLTRFLAATAYPDVYEQAAYANGYNLAESLDNVVRAVAGQGSRVFYPSGVTARTSINGKDNSGHRLSTTMLERIATIARGIKMPLFEDNTLAMVIHPFCHYDLLQDTNLQTMASRQHPEIQFNGEIAYWSGLRLIVSGNAKAFWGGGAANGSNAFSSTTAAAIAVGDSNIKGTSFTNLAATEYMAIQDAAETGNTWTDTNEVMYVTAVGTTGAGGTGVDGFMLDPGPGDSGGARYAHASGVTINDKGAAFPISILGPNSITKAASSFTGPYGETVVTGPFDKLGRFLTFGWYAILGYARTRNGWLLRLECGSSQI